MSRTNIAKITRWHTKTHTFTVIICRFKITCKIINHLRNNTPPVNTVNRANMKIMFEMGIPLNGFYNILTIIKHTLHSNVVNIIVLQAIHLCTLKCRHLAFGRQHEYMNPFFASQSIFRSRTCIATGRTQNI